MSPENGPENGPKNGNELMKKINDALRLVIDPELGYNIYDLGLIYGVEIEGGNAVTIKMTTTTRGCPATNYLKSGAYEAAAGVPDVASATVELTYDPPWSPQMMTDDAKRHLGIYDGD